MSWPPHHTFTYLLDDEGNPIPCRTEGDFIKASQLLKDMDKRRVGLDVVNGIEISTVFLVHDHGLGTFPILWETALSTMGAFDIVDRYTSLEEAQQGHTKWKRKAAEAKDYETLLEDER